MRPAARNGRGIPAFPERAETLIAASQEGSLLQEAEQEVVERVLNIGDRRISDIMTPRVDVDSIDIEDDREAILRCIRECRFDRLPDTAGRRLSHYCGLRVLGHLPETGEHFDSEGWRFEVMDLDGRRIDKVLAILKLKETSDSRESLAPMSAGVRS
jgi:CBS domain containing-hemolysin-like protein